MDRLLRVSEAAALLRISKSGIYRLATRHEIPHLRLGARVLFRERDLEQWVQEQMVECS